jgi:hypothetical protein
VCSRSARRFKGQEDFENQIRACFHELQRIAFASRNTLVDIQIPEDVGCPPLKLRRAASATSETGISDARVDAKNSDAGGPPLTRARARRPATRSTPDKVDIQRTWRINPSHLFEIDIDDTGTHLHFFFPFIESDEKYVCLQIFRIFFVMTTS